MGVTTESVKKICICSVDISICFLLFKKIIIGPRNEIVFAVFVFVSADKFTFLFLANLHCRCRSLFRLSNKHFWKKFWIFSFFLSEWETFSAYCFYEQRLWKWQLFQTKTSCNIFYWIVHIVFFSSKPHMLKFYI